MNIQDSATPAYEYPDQWNQWHQLPDYHHYPSYHDSVVFSGLPDRTLHPHWHQRHTSFDHGSSWAAQTPMTTSASSPTSLSRTTSWPPIPPSSAWTTPLASPERALPQVATPAFSITTPFSNCVSTPSSTAPTSVRPMSISYGGQVDAYDAYRSPQHTPLAYSQMVMNGAYHSRPSISAVSSPAMFSRRPSQPTVQTYNPPQSHINGLGIGPVQDLAYPVFMKDDDQLPSPQTQGDSSNTRRLTSRRKRKGQLSSTKRNRPFRCPYCSFSFDRKCNLTCHLKTHGVGRGKVTCPEPGCGKEYGRQADVNRHIRTAHNGASFTCDDCGKTFGRNDILMRHEESCSVRKSGAGREKREYSSDDFFGSSI